MGKNRNDEANQKVSIEKIKFQKTKLILVIILFLIPIVFTIYSSVNNEKIKVGIVLTNDELFNDGVIARDGLNQFEDIFQAKILDTRFNESKVRVRDGEYLNEDYFDSSFANNINEKYQIDIILILTNKSINNWLGDGQGIWGQADTKNAIAVMTTIYYQKNQTLHQQYIISTARHELLHLLGYVHPSDSKRCVTQYATLDTELCLEHKIDLKFRVVLWKIGNNHDYFLAASLIRLSMFLIFSTIFVALIIIIQFLFKRYFYKKDKISQNPFIFGIGTVFINILISSVFIHSIFAYFIWLISIVFIYLIVEAISYELHSKNKTKIDKNIEKNKHIK